MQGPFHPLFHAVSCHVFANAPMPISFCRLCGGLDLGQSLALLESALLLQAQDLEAVEVGQVAALLLLVLGLGPAALLPLGVDLGLLPELLDGTSAGSTGQLLNDKRCEEDVRQVDSLSGDDELGVGGRTVNQNLNSQSISRFVSNFISVSALEMRARACYFALSVSFSV